MSIFDTISRVRVLPVLVIDDAKNAPGLAHAMLDGGLPLVEVTLRTDASWESLEAFRAREEFTVGVGSVTTLEQMKRAKDLGVDFAVSPGYLDDLVELAHELSLPYFPGVATPSEVMAGLRAGLDIMKWFPAETLGGITALRAIAAPFPKTKFVPTGGISASNAKSYLAERNVAAIGGSWMLSREKIAAGDFTGVKEDVKTALDSMKDG